MKHDTEVHLERTRVRLARFGVDVKDDEKRGRCLVAAKDFKRGDLVLASMPYGLPVPMGDRCAGCFLQKEGDEAEKKIRCSVSVVRLDTFLNHSGLALSSSAVR